MSKFLDSLENKLIAMEQEIENLPGKLDSLVARLDRGKLRRLFFSLDQDFNKLLDRLFDGQRINALLFPFVLMPNGLNGPLYRRITEDDLAKWRAAWKSDVRVVLGKEGVELIAISELSQKYNLKVPEIILAAQRQGYVVLGWDQYQKLLDEIGKLIAGGEEPGRITEPSGTIVGIPLSTTAPNKATKLLT